MTKEVLEKLKNDLKALKIRDLEKKAAKRKKERESIEADIQFMTKKIIDKYQLIKYDEGIMMEYYKTHFFIFDVEDIIRDLENDEK